MSAINSFCRTCMTNVIDNAEEDVYSCNIFETEGLAEKLMLCSNVEITPYDEYPPQVCNTCCINILDFCDFREMCRESLEKFDKMLKKQRQTSGYKELLGGNASAEALNDGGATPIEIDSESEVSLSAHEMILGDHSVGEDSKDTGDYYDSDNMADNDPLKGKQGSVISEAIMIARCETLENVISCEHDYGQSEESAIERSRLGSDDKSENEQDDNTSQVTVNEDAMRLEYMYDENQKPSKNVSPYDNNRKEIISANDVECSLVEEDMDENVHSLENLSENEEIFSEINVISSDPSIKRKQITLSLDKTDVANAVSLSTENICLDQDKDPDFCMESETNAEQLENAEFENNEKCTIEDHKNTTLSLLENEHFENEEECIFEDLSEDETNDKARLKDMLEDESNENYSFASPTEDEEIYSDSDSAFGDNKTRYKKFFRCDLCPQTFILEQRLNAHKRRHQGLKGYPCTHKNCTRSFQRLIDLRQHYDDHNGIPRKVYKCKLDNCELQYTSKTGLQLHMRKFHKHGRAVPTNKYICEDCGKVYKHAHGLRVHHYIHVDESLWPFKCDVEGCNKSFRSKNNYKIHKNRHDGIKPFVCIYCDKRFCAGTNLRVHMNFHTLEKKWTCSFCPRVCYTPATLRLHIRNKHKNNSDVTFPCRICNQVLATHSAWQSHESKHIGEKKPCDCKKCGRSFTNSTALDIHSAKHFPAEKGKKFPCTFCLHVCSTASSLKSHEMKHTGEKPFVCGVCGVKFRYQSNFIRHRKQNSCKKSKIRNDNAATKKEVTAIIDENGYSNSEDTQ